MSRAAAQGLLSIDTLTFRLEGTFAARDVDQLGVVADARPAAPRARPSRGGFHARRAGVVCSSAPWRRSGFAYPGDELQLADHRFVLPNP